MIFRMWYFCQIFSQVSRNRKPIVYRTTFVNIPSQFLDEDVLTVQLWPASSVSQNSATSLTKNISGSKRRRRFSIRTSKDDERHGK